MLKEYLSTIPELLDAISDAIFVLSSQGDILGHNAPGQKIADSAGRSPRKLADIFFSELALGAVFAKKDATPIQSRKISIGNSTYTVRALFCGKNLALVLCDGTDARNMAADISLLLSQLSRFRMACNLLPAGIVIADPFEKILFANTAMRELLSARGVQTAPMLLSDLEAVFGVLPAGEEPLCPVEVKEEGAPSSGAGHGNKNDRLLVEKRTLLSSGKIHGSLLRFSKAGDRAGDAESWRPMKKSSPEAEREMAAGMAKGTDRGSKTEKKDTGRSYSLAQFVGQSKAVLHIKTIIRKVAISSSTVLLQSESGTGKELLAHSLHELSERANGPFVKLNCASLPESLLEAEVFGYDSGAFTGAKKSGNPGLFEQAHTGTIFLDEIGEMSLPLQAKLLRIIQEKEVQRLGGQDSKRLDVRVVCATNRNLLHLVEQGKFRNDLLFRLNVVSIAIPPLKDRKEDIKSLIIHYLREYSRHFKKRVNGVSKEVYYLFMNYEWPGNVRELGNILEYAFNIIDGGTIELKHLPQYIFESKRLSGNLSGRLESIVGEYSLQVLHNTLELYNGNKAAAASALGISRSKLYRLMARK